VKTFWGHPVINCNFIFAERRLDTEHLAPSPPLTYGADTFLWTHFLGTVWLLHVPQCSMHEVNKVNP